MFGSYERSGRMKIYVDAAEFVLINLCGRNGFVVI